MASEPSSGIPTRLLGATRERVSIIGVGGHHIGRPADAETGIRIIRTAIDAGINLLDNAWCYHDGRSEEIMAARRLPAARLPDDQEPRARRRDVPPAAR